MNQSESIRHSNPSTIRPGMTLFLVVSYVFWISVTLRWVMEFIEQSHPLIYVLGGILVVYAVLLGLETRITTGSIVRAHLYMAIQTGLVFSAMLLYYELDFFAILFLPLCGQAISLFPRRAALTWVAILILATFFGQIIQFGWPDALPFVLLYSAGIVFVAAFMTVTLQAERSRRRSEQLLEELQQAHQQLQVYAGQAEELAIARERNRLARELHDSVAQTLYGLNLRSAAALRRLDDGQLDQVAETLQDIQASSQQTLKETRLLIYELRHPEMEKQTLVSALQARLEAVERRSGLRVEMEVGSDIDPLPDGLKNGLYRIAQEALNNTLKHAQARAVRIEVSQGNGMIRMQISDDGQGFDPEDSLTRGGLGFKGMQERAEQIQAELMVFSAPGSGTQILVEAPYE